LFDDQNCTVFPEVPGLIDTGGAMRAADIQSMERCMDIKMNRLMRYALLAAVALSWSATAAISLWPEKASAKCKTGHFDAGLGNGSSLGDPGSSGAHNQAGNAPAQPGSAAAKADGAHENDDSDEPN
jgi:hypothetical protein